MTFIKGVKQNHRKDYKYRVIPFLKRWYPTKGKKWCMEELQLSEGVVRGLCERLKLRQDRSSDFFKDWQRRAKESKIKPQVERKCKTCGKIFFKKQGQLNAQPYIFCSPKCNGVEIAKRWKERGHPKGMKGKHHSEITKKILSEKGLGRKVKQETIMKILKTREKNGSLIHYRPSASWKLGKADDLGDIYFRSSWERNYARYLNFLIKQKKIKSWEYEKDVFWFEKIKRGVVSYKPDFKILNFDETIEYHEVKGWMDKKSATKLKRMRIYYPKIKLVLIDSKAYKELNKMGKLFSPYWEF